MEDSEQYTVKELFQDIEYCKSRRVVLVADQAYSSQIINVLNQHPFNYRNFVLFSPGEKDNRRSLVAALGNLTPWKCLSDLGPSWVGEMGSNFTISGFSCGNQNTEVPSGCQRLSTLEMLESEVIL